MAGCNRPIKARRMCAGHYAKWRKTRPVAQACSREDCERPVSSRGLCDPHYQQWLRNPDDSAPIAAPLVKFFRKVNKTDTCWLWTGYTDAWGYGKHKSRFGPSTTLAYKWLWEFINGPVAEGMQLDHLCRTPACVNPAHLEVVTPRVNGMRSGNVASVNSRKTHCVNGHEFAPENVYVRPSGGRDCRACTRLRHASKRAGKRQASPDR